MENLAAAGTKCRWNALSDWALPKVGDQWPTSLPSRRALIVDDEFLIAFDSLSQALVTLFLQGLRPQGPRKKGHTTDGMN